MEAVAEEVTERIAEVSARLAQCEETGEQYLAALAQTMENHKHLYELTKTYNNKATTFMFMAADVEEEIEQPLSFDSVAEVETAIAHLESTLREVHVHPLVV